MSSSEGRDIRSIDVVIATTSIKQRLSPQMLYWEDSSGTLQADKANAGIIYIGGEDNPVYPLDAGDTLNNLDNIDPYYIFIKGTAADILHVLITRKKPTITNPRLITHG
jgi:hypothetical protein